MSGPARRPLIDRAMAFVMPEPNSGCWLWLGGIQGGGYGIVRRGSKRDGSLVAHRAIYEHFVGPVPDGLELDHKCKVRCCVNPAHLEPVTHLENIKRGFSYNARKTHCPQGHAFALHGGTRTNGKRYCRKCNRLRMRVERKV